MFKKYKKKINFFKKYGSTILLNNYNIVVRLWMQHVINN
jgi:hypothetical protein